jgi:hypothetical protein
LGDDDVLFPVIAVGGSSWVSQNSNPTVAIEGEAGWQWPKRDYGWVVMLL